MEEDTEKIFKDQLRKLPKEVITFLSSANWDTDANEIASLYNLSLEEASAFTRGVTLVLAGLVHPDEFGAVLELEVGIQGAVLEALVKATEEKIFAPIRPALVGFFKKKSEQVEENFALLPDEVQEMVYSPMLELKTEKIALDAGLKREQLKDFNSMVNSMILGLLPEKDFITECQKEFGIQREVAEKIDKVVSDEILSPIETIKIKTIREKARQVSENVPETPEVAEVAPTEAPRVQAPGAVPFNLPTEEVESFLPKLTPKPVTLAPAEQPAVHPFEEKMKSVFTAEMAPAKEETTPVRSASDDIALVGLTPDSQQQTSGAPTSSSYRVDPYREAIE